MFSDVKVFEVTGNDKILARGSFLYDKKIRINYTLFPSAQGPFVGLPGKYGKPDESGKGKWYSDVFIENKADMASLNKVVVDAYNKRKEQTPATAAGDEEVPF